MTVPCSNPHQLLVLLVYFKKIFSHSQSSVVYFICFHFHFPNDMWCWASFPVLICSLYIFFGEMSESSAHFSIGQCIYIYIYISWRFLYGPQLVLSLHSLSEEITNRPGSFIPTPVEASLGSPRHSAVTRRNLLGCERACDLHICSSFTYCGSAGLVKNWFLLLLPYTVICGEKLLLLIWLHPWLCSCQIGCMENLQNVPFPWLSPSCLLLLPAVNTSQVPPMYLLIFTPSCNESLEVLVHKTNEKRESYWCMG